MLSFLSKIIRTGGVFLAFLFFALAMGMPAVEAAPSVLSQPTPGNFALVAAGGGQPNNMVLTIRDINHVFWDAAGISLDPSVIGVCDYDIDSPSDVDCPTTVITTIIIDAGDGENRVTINGTTRPTTIYSGNDNDILYVNAALPPATLDIEPGDGNDTVYINDTGVPTNVNLSMGGNYVYINHITDVVMISGGGGSDSISLADASGDLNDIQANVVVTGEDSDDSLSILDWNSSTARTYTVTGTDITFDGITVDRSGSPIMQAVNLYPGTGDDTLFLKSTPSGEMFTYETIGGTDSLYLTDNGIMDNIEGDVALYNDGGGNNITIDDSAATTGKTVDVEYAQVIGLSPGIIAFEAALGTNLIIQSGDFADDYRFTGTPDGTVAVYMNGGDDAVRVGGYLDVIDSFFATDTALDGGSGTDVLSLVDTANIGTPRTVDWDATTISGTGTDFPITYAGFETYNYSQGADNDTVVLTAPPTGIGGFTIHQGLGDDNLIVNGFDSSGGLFIYQEDDNDELTMSNFVGTATIDGGAGNNTLHASSWGTGTAGKTATIYIADNADPVDYVIDGDQDFQNTGFIGFLVGTPVLALDGTIIFTTADSVAADDLRIDTTLTDNTGGDGLSKEGAGRMLLTGPNSYTGPTNIVTGTLFINGDQNSSPVSVQNDSVLGGTGTIGDVTVQDTGILAPGQSPGILHAGTVTWNSGTTYGIEINGVTAGSGYDQLLATGDVVLGNATLNATLGFTSAGGQSFTIIQTSGTVSGTFNGLSHNSLVTLGGVSFRIGYNPDSVTLTRSSSSGGGSVLDPGISIQMPAPLTGLKMLSEKVVCRATDYNAVLPGLKMDSLKMSINGIAVTPLITVLNGNVNGVVTSAEMTYVPDVDHLYPANSTVRVRCEAINNNNRQNIANFQFLVGTNSNVNAGNNNDNRNTNSSSLGNENMNSPNFQDVPADYWAREYIIMLSQTCGVQGYMDSQGNLLNQFHPDEPITRAELLTMLLKCKAGTLAAIAQSPFPDVPATHWAAPYLAQGKELGVVEGYKDEKQYGLFVPDGRATRAEALKMISLIWFSRETILTTPPNNTCQDVETPQWYASYFYWATVHNILTGDYDSSGKTTGRCAPSRVITRAEAAKLIILTKLLHNS